ncbi:MAG: hypothetical protein J6Y28_08700 [Acholeplasmatales bacterium]|nr:hypothetical protein [Acholeplasmatales bacterium]
MGIQSGINQALGTAGAAAAVGGHLVQQAQANKNATLKELDQYEQDRQAYNDKVDEHNKTLESKEYKEAYNTFNAETAKSWEHAAKAEDIQSSASAKMAMNAQAGIEVTDEEIQKYAFAMKMAEGKAAAAHNRASKVKQYLDDIDKQSDRLDYESSRLDVKEHQLMKRINKFHDKDIKIVHEQNKK